MHDHLNNTYVHDEFLEPYFGPYVAKKTVGNRLIFWILVPGITNGLILVWLTLGCLYACVCGSKKTEPETTTT